MPRKRAINQRKVHEPNETNWLKIASAMEPAAKDTVREALAIVDVTGVNGFAALTQIPIFTIETIVNKGKPTSGKRFRPSTIRMIWIVYGLLFEPKRLESIESMMTYGRVMRECRNRDVYESKKHLYPDPKLLDITRKMALNT